MNSPTENLPEAPKDLRRICPFLGLMDDPETSSAFPADINFCHAAEPPGVPSFDHQSTRCLALTYLGCPVYSAKEKGPLPADIRLRMKGGGVKINIQPTGVVRTIGAVIIAVLIFFIGWFGVQGISRSINENTAAKTQAGAPILLPVTPTSPLPTQTPYSPPTPTPQITPTATETPTAALVNPSNSLPPPAACGRPAGWVGYTVRPNDTLSYLGRSYGVSVAQLQNANCLGSSTILHVGTILYVPPGAAIVVVPTVEPTWPVPVEVPTITLTPEATATAYEPPFFSSTPIPTDTQVTIPGEPINP